MTARVETAVRMVLREITEIRMEIIPGMAVTARTVPRAVTEVRTKTDTVTGGVPSLTKGNAPF